jgi:PGF-pre-PGF domain-containing protein
MKNISKFEFIVFLSVIIISISCVSAIDDACQQTGQIVVAYGENSYCNITLDPVKLKSIGDACENSFECLNKSCLEGVCSAGYAREIAAKEGLLQQIFDLLSGKLPADFKQITPNESVVFTASDMKAAANTPIESVTIAVTEDAAAKVNFQDYGSIIPTASGVSLAPPGILYHYISLSTYKDISDSIDYADIEIKIQKSWFETNSADKNAVSVYRWNNEWTKLNTKLSRETADYIYFNATSPGFSVFAITAFAIVQAQQNASQQKQPTCSDGIQNQGETGADCGGPCANKCSGTCGNGIKDANENCESCKLDAPCTADQVCKYRQCVGKPFPFWTVFFIVIAVVIIGFVGLKVTSKSGQNKKREIERLSNTISYAMSAMQQNMKENEIKSNLLKAGWSIKQVNLAIDEAKKRMRSIKKK